MIRLLLILCVAGLLSPLPAAGATALHDGRARKSAIKSVMLNDEFALRVGQEAMLADRKLKLRFVAVREDSRCPKGVTCIWAGSARVALSMTTDKRKPVDIEINSNPRGQQGAADGTHGNYRVKLVGVAPYPVEGRQLAAKDYVITLVVSKAD